MFELTESTKLLNEDSLQEDGPSSQQPPVRSSSLQLPSTSRKVTEPSQAPVRSSSLQLPSTSRKTTEPSTNGKRRNSVSSSQQEEEIVSEPTKTVRSRKTCASSSQQVTHEKVISEPSKKSKDKTPVKSLLSSQQEKVISEPSKTRRASSQQEAEILQVENDQSSDDEIPSSQLPAASRLSKRKSIISSKSQEVVMTGKRVRKPTEKVRQRSVTESPDKKKQKVSEKSKKVETLPQDRANPESEPLPDQVINATTPKSPASNVQASTGALSPTQVTPPKSKRGLKPALVGDTQEVNDEQDLLSLVLEDVDEVGPTQVIPEIERRDRRVRAEDPGEAPTSVVEVTSGKRQRKPRNFDDSIWATPTSRNR